MKKIYINGYFTKEHINGVPRYGMEIVKRIDKYFKPGEAELVVPRNATNIPSLENISINTWEDRGSKKENESPMWGMYVFGPYVRKNKGICVNFSNRAEWVKDSITALHDTISLQNHKYGMKLGTKDLAKIKLKQFVNKIWFYSKVYVKKYTARVIVTVSEYSKKELCEGFHFKPERVKVIGNGWEHIKDINEKDEKIDERIQPGQFYFFIGNLYPHKNLKWIFEEAKRMPEAYFVIAGKLPYSIVDMLQEGYENIILLGHISDEYMKFLMKNCKALLFPSFIEGFGIPPLEAIAVGGKAIVADIPVMREIYGNSVYYVDPNNGNIDLDELLNSTVESADAVLEEHSWNKTAKKWFELIEELRAEME